MLGQSRSGNSLVEYVLPLIIFFGVATVLLFEDVPGRFQSLLARAMHGQAQGTVLKVSPLGAPHTLGVGPSAGLTTIEVTMSGGETFILDNYPSDLLQVVETAGANGATKRLLATLEQAIAAFEASGEIDSEQANELRALANQGHRMAMIEDVIYGHLNNPQNFSSGQDYRGSLLVFEGEEMTVQKLANRVGWDPQEDFVVDNLYADPLTTMPHAGKDLKKFLALYHQAENKGAMRNPTVHALVQDLTSKITILGGAVEHSVDNLAHVYDSEADVKMAFEKKIIEGAATATDQHSATICRTGGNQDDGKHCSGQPLIQSQ